VLDSAGGEAFELEADLTTGGIDALERDACGTLDRNSDVLQREAALLIGLLLVGRLDDARIRHCLRTQLVVLEDEHPLQDPELRGGKADALGVFHHLHHPLGERGQVVVELGDVLRLHAERDIRVLADLGERVAAQAVALALTRLRDLLLAQLRLVLAVIVIVVVIVLMVVTAVIVIVIVIMVVLVIVVVCHSVDSLPVEGTKLRRVLTLAAAAAVLTVLSASGGASRPARAAEPVGKLGFVALAERDLARTEKVFADPQAHWYYERLPKTWNPRKPLARLWAAFPLFEAIDAVAIADPTPANKAAVQTFALGAEKYFNPTIKPVGGYDWYPGIRNPKEHTYFDDNGWWELAYLDAYRATGDAVDLHDAELAFRFIAVSGWDPDGGGVWWETLHLHKTSEPLAAEIYAGFALYEYTHQATYLKTADRFLAWANRYSWNAADGLYQRNATDATVLDYVEGMMIGADLEDCQIKNVQGPCKAAEQLAQDSVKYFPYYANWTPAADMIYLRFMLDLYQADGNPAWYDLVKANAVEARKLAIAPDGFYFRHWDGTRFPVRLLQPDAATLALFAWLGGTPPPPGSKDQTGNSSRTQLASSGSRR
jgi:Glycosyl hydrolase family 76